MYMYAVSIFNRGTRHHILHAYSQVLALVVSQVLILAFPNLWSGS